MIQLVVVGVRDLSGLYESLTFSNTDPGGFEQLSCQLRDSAMLYPGQKIVAYVNGSLAWSGLIEEISPHSAFGVATYTLSALGHKALLDRRSYAEVYIDRDLTHWGNPSAYRQISPQYGRAWTAAGQALASEDNSRVSCIALVTDGPLNMTSMEMVYDGNGISLGGLLVGYRSNVGVSDGDGTVLEFVVAGTSPDLITSAWYEAKRATPWITWPGSSGALGGAPGYPVTCFALDFYYSGAAGGAAGSSYGVMYGALAIIGQHGIPFRNMITTGDGTTGITLGFYPQDVVADAVKRTASGLIEMGTVDIESNGYVLNHLVSFDQKTGTSWIADMAALLGWSWGVWDDALWALPRLDFHTQPIVPTCSVRLADCADAEPPVTRFSQTYDTAIVKYTTTGGQSRSVTVTLPNPDIPDGKSATLTLDSGLSSAAAATTFGQMALGLAQRARQGGGSAVLPVDVALPGGGSKHAALLRAGKDRLQIPDIGNDYHVRRVETTVDASGASKTSVQLDQGADLMEVLTARKAVVAAVYGG